jgi:hypothetical protein
MTTPSGPLDLAEPGLGRWPWLRYTVWALAGLIVAVGSAGGVIFLLMLIAAWPA